MTMLSAGNSKLSRKVGIFNLPAIFTCPNCKTCYETCYAKQAEVMYKGCREQRKRNLELSALPKTEFYELIMKELPKFDIIRIHESGDFYNQEYINKWHMIIKENPNIKFYGYTKVKEALSLNEYDNCNIIYSFIDGYRNYGSKDYCEKLQDNHNAYICNLPHNGKCMEDCKECLTNDKVCFIIHGIRKNKDKYEVQHG